MRVRDLYTIIELVYPGMHDWNDPVSLNTSNVNHLERSWIEHAYALSSWVQLVK